MVKKACSILRKNIQISFNSKASSFIIILGPIILIGLIGFALQDASLKNARAGIFIHEEDIFSDKFMTRLSEKNFQVSQLSTLEECRQRVIDGTNHVCIELNKESLTQDYQGYKTNLYVDFSKQRIVWQIIGSIQAIIEEESNSARQSIALSLQGESATLSTQLLNEETKIDNALDKIYRAKQYSNKIETTQNNVLNYLSQSKSIIMDIRNNLENISSSNLLVPPYSNMLFDSFIEISSIENKLNNIQTSINSNDVNDAKSELNRIETDLLNTKDSIKNIRSDLNNINDADINKISDPVTLSYQSVLDNESKTVENKLNSLDYLFPSFLMFFLVFGAIIFSAILRIRERKSNAYIRNILSKAKGPEFILSEFVTTFILLVVQIAIIFLVASYFLNLSIIPNLISIIILIFISITIFSLIGITLGSIIDSQEAILIAAVSLSILFFIFSSIIIPVETLPEPFASGVGLLPLTLFETKIRASLIFSLGLKFSIIEIMATLLWVLIPLTITALAYTKKKRKEI